MMAWPVQFHDFCPEVFKGRKKTKSKLEGLPLVAPMSLAALSSLSSILCVAYVMASRVLFFVFREFFFFIIIKSIFHIISVHLLDPASSSLLRVHQDTKTPKSEKYRRLFSSQSVTKANKNGRAYLSVVFYLFSLLSFSFYLYCHPILQLVTGSSADQTTFAN